MASITLTVPDAEAIRTLDGFAAHHKYREAIANPDYNPEVDDESLATIANPETKIQFMKNKLIDFVKESVKAEETRVAIAAVRTSVVTPPDIT